LWDEKVVGFYLRHMGMKRISPLPRGTWGLNICEFYLEGASWMKY